jgi:hypothetical protein
MRRIALIIAAVAVFVGVQPGTAFGWANGPTRNGNPGQGYGTHDWILDRAVTLAGADGAWVVRTTALLATDDPDFGRSPVGYHWYASGSSRGAPYAVSELYHRALASLRSGDRVAASRYLGQMSHYYADINQPFHTSSAATAHGTLHIQYEKALDPIQYSGTRVTSWVTRRPRVPVTDIRAKTVSAALYARSLYPQLYASYKASHSVRTGTANKITRLVLSRAVNDLADIIVAIRSGSGEATSPAAVSMGLSSARLRPDQRIGAFVTCTDTDGRPLNAVRVLFVWHLSTGTETCTAYTDSAGYAAARYTDIGPSPFTPSSYVSACITVNGTTATHSLSFVPTR